MQRYMPLSAAFTWVAVGLGELSKRQGPLPALAAGKTPANPLRTCARTRSPRTLAIVHSRKSTRFPLVGWRVRPETQKRPYILLGGERNTDIRCPLPVSSGLASRAYRIRLPFLLKAERPLEQRRGCGLGLSLATLRPDRLLVHELGPGEQRPLRFVALLVVAVGWDKLDRRTDGIVMAVCPVAVDLDRLRLDFHQFPSLVHQQFLGGGLGVPGPGEAPPPPSQRPHPR